MTVSPRTLPDCWGHRGASARFPENTLASFEAAIRDGAEGIESDVHVSLDDVVIMFHDPDLSRTTDSSGQIKEKNWYGPDGMENVRTTKEPKQAIPTFAETVSLLMKPENLHVKFNIDVKVQNDPARTFPLMHKAISAHPDWETTLAPRLVLGLWHPMFLPYAKEFLPYCRRSYIGINPSVAKKYFWDDCDTFSIAFPVLATYEGERFRMECKEAGKTLMVWTVNKPEQMMEAVRWGVDCILTDVTQTWLELRSALKADYDKIDTQYGRTFLWTSVLYYSPTIYTFQYLSNWRLAKLGGPFDRKVVVAPAESKAVAGVA